jgi:hypothetical protein
LVKRDDSYGDGLGAVAAAQEKEKGRYDWGSEKVKCFLHVITSKLCI